MRRVILGGSVRHALVCLRKWGLAPSRQRLDPQLGQKLLQDPAKEEVQWAAVHRSPCTPFECLSLTEPNSSFHKRENLRELPVTLPAGLQGTDLPLSFPGHRHLLLKTDLWMSPKLPLNCPAGDSPPEQGHLSRCEVPYLGLGDSSLEIYCENDPQKPAQPLAAVHLLTYGLFRGRMVAIKPRTHKLHMRPDFMKIKMYTN